MKVVASVPNQQKLGTSVSITATVEAAAIPIPGAAVTATVTKPDGIIHHVVLFDNGVDIIVPHAFFYTTEGELQYKDYPPSFFYQNEILWPNMKEYVGYVNEKNKTKNTSTYAIVVYPIKKAWSLFDPSNSSEIDKLDKELKNNVRKLIKEDIMFILVPDYLLEK